MTKPTTPRPRATTTVADRPRAGQQTTGVPRETTALQHVPKQLQPFAKQFDLDRDKVDLIKRVCCPDGTTDDQMALFFHECARRGVHPMDRLLIMVLFREGDDEGESSQKSANGKKPVFITTIDLLRSQGEESGQYGGIEAPKFGPPHKVSDGGFEAPTWATVRAFRLVDGQRIPFEGRAKWSEFYPGARRGKKWKQSPETMLGKCAEAQALRKAFPKKLARLYAREEMDQALALEEATPVGRGRTKAAEPLPDHVDDIHDAEESETPPADRWTVSRVTPGQNKQKQRVWEVLAQSGDLVDERYYTQDAAMADTLERFKDQRTVFTVVYETRGGYKWLLEIAPL